MMILVIVVAFAFGVIVGAFGMVDYMARQHRVRQ